MEVYANPWPAICFGLIIIILISVVSFYVLKIIGERKRKNNPLPPSEGYQEGTGSQSNEKMTRSLGVLQAIAVILMSIGLSLVIVAWLF